MTTEHGANGITQAFEIAVVAIEASAVALLVVGLLVSTWTYARMYFQVGAVEAYDAYRRNLGRCLILGLEILIAADIVETVIIEMTLESVLVLGLLVLVRTFLSYSLEVELTGRWPWQGKGGANGEK